MNKNNVGVWIPPEIMNIKGLSFIEKGVYVEIINLCKIGKCYASNKHFSDMFTISERSVTRCLENLIGLNLIRYVGSRFSKNRIIILDKKSSITTITENILDNNASILDKSVEHPRQIGDINIQEININKQGIKSLREFFEKEGKNITKQIK